MLRSFRLGISVITVPLSFLLVMTFAGIGSTWASGSALQSTHKSPQILVSIKPLALIVKDIVGEHADVDVLIGPSDSSHHFQLKVSDKRKIDSADLLVWVGPALETYLRKAISSRESVKKSTISISQLLVEHPGYLSNEGSASDTRDTKLDAKSSREHSVAHAKDMHVWLSPDLMSQAYVELAKRLSVLYPALSHTFSANAVEGAHRLKAKGAYWKSRMNSLAVSERRKFVAFHDSLTHLTNTFDLPAPAYLTQVPDESIGVRRLRELRREVDGLQCMVADKSEYSAAQKYGAKLGLPVIGVDLLASDYTAGDRFDEFWSSIAQRFSSCFRP